MIVNFIITVIFVILLLTGIILVDNNTTKIFICILSFFGFILGVCNMGTYTPAIEVYRGKTELQITYEGDTPIDSTVVWKHK